MAPTFLFSLEVMSLGGRRDCIRASMDSLITSNIKSTWQFRAQALPVGFTKPFEFDIK